MKRVFVIMICLSFFIVGCKKEEQETGDINYKKNVDALSNEIFYEVNGYKLTIKSEYAGMPYNDSLFSYMINNENGMFIVEYKDILDDPINLVDYQEYILNDVSYWYKLDNDYMDIVHYVDDNNYLSISIENLNNEFNDDIIFYLIDQLDYEVSL